MERFLSGKALWSTLRQLSKDCRTRQMVAVPYIGKNARSLLNFSRNDVLICALTEGNSKAGNINPAEIRLLQERGVRIYLRDDLHAKVYLFGNKAVICSANLSETSKKRLDETGLLTNNPRIIKEIRGWFDERLGEPVMPGWLKHCEDIYRPPKGPVISIKGKKKAEVDERRVWIVFGRTVDFPKSEDKARKLGHDIAKMHLEKPRTHNIDEWRFGSDTVITREAKPADVVIQIYRSSNQSPYRVCPHGKLLGKKQFTNRKGASVTYLYLELPSSYRTISLEKFREVCADAGLKLGKGHRTREVRDRVAQDLILKAISPEKLKK